MNEEQEDGEDEWRTRRWRGWRMNEELGFRMNEEEEDGEDEGWVWMKI